MVCYFILRHEIFYHNQRVVLQSSLSSNNRKNLLLGRLLRQCLCEAAATTAVTRGSKHQFKLTTRNFTPQSSSMVIKIDTVLTSLGLCSCRSLRAQVCRCAKDDTDMRVSLWIAASEFMTDGKPTEELKSCESTHSL